MTPAQKLKPIRIQNIFRCFDGRTETSFSEPQVIDVRDGIIAWMGPANEASPPAPGTVFINAKDRLVTPGLIDCHTHFVFAGWRQAEFEQRLLGKSYLDIAKAGGGIASSMMATRSASEDELFASGHGRLDAFLRQGITTVEGKSGYGLDHQTEKKVLSVMKRLNQTHAVDVVSTFLGAHALPPEHQSDRGQFLKLVCQDMIPAVAQDRLATFCDVFCDVGAFTADESRKVLLAAKSAGLKLKIHTEEFEPIGGAAVAAELGAISADHLCRLGPDDMLALAQANVVGVVLPGTAFFLNLPNQAPAKAMVEAGMDVAIASDFNPGSNASTNLPLMGTFACLQMGLTPQEVFRGLTLNAAKALDLDNDRGTLDLGKRADIAIFDVQDVASLFYRYGENHLKTVLVGGARIDADTLS